ncbi:MAG: hypothetical protein D8M59_03160 [Planctomycetes bacterium]|nr:hypothetical protein [Planctomycetota bacterium]NOG52993.1 hypothetical protein [Planctomycetota bacterium]
MSRATVQATPTIDIGKSRQWGWWWKVSLGLLLACFLCTKPLIDQWLTWPVQRWWMLVWWPGVAVWSVTCIWLFAVAPIMDAANPNRAWASEPVKHVTILRQFTWAPAALIGLSILGLAVILPLWHYLDSNRWVWGLAPWMIILIPCLIASIVYGLIMKRTLHLRVEAAASSRRICFQCGYDLRGNLSNGRCPECGYDFG